MKVDHFAGKAEHYEQNQERVDNVAAIANTIQKLVCLNRSMHIMDFGSGTGLLLERIAPHVGKITAVDVSSAMNTQLRTKQKTLGCEIEILEMDLEKSSLNQQFDGIVSSMTLHHIKDIENLFSTFRSMLKEGGFIALADLDTEDGHFHTEDTGVFHHGFDRKWISNMAEKVGFHSVQVASTSVIHKPQGHYPVFLLIAIR